MTKICPRCGVLHPVAQFSKNKNRADGLQAYCKACSKAANASHEGRNKARSVVTYPARKACATCGVDKVSAEYFKDKRRKDGLYSNCKSCHTSVTTSWKKRNPYVQREIGLRSYRKNAGARRAYTRAWRASNLERARVACAAWKVANRAHATALQTVRASRYRDAPGNATPLQVLARWEYFGGRCWMCGGDAVETDHVKPLCAGGSNWPSNLRPACATCNRTKNGAWPFPTAVYRAVKLVR